MELEVYKTKHGEPNENSRADIVVPGTDGMLMVILKQTSDTWTKAKRFVNQQVKRCVMDDGSDPSSDKFIEQRWTIVAPQDALICMLCDI